MFYTLGLGLGLDLGSGLDLGLGSDLVFGLGYLGCQLENRLTVNLGEEELGKFMVNG